MELQSSDLYLGSESINALCVFLSPLLSYDYGVYFQHACSY